MTLVLRMKKWRHVVEKMKKRVNRSFCSTVYFFEICVSDGLM